MKDVDFLKNNLFAHRGYHDIKLKIAENSLDSFKRAIRHGYSIELDVHMLKDGNIIVFHDDNLKRVCNVDKIVNHCTYDEIKNLKLFDTKSTIPLLEDALKVIDGKVPILIEIKYYPKYGELEKALLDKLKVYKGKFVIQSFYPKAILWFKKNTKTIPVGLLSSDFKNSDNSLKKAIGKTLVFDLFFKVDFISYDIRAIPNVYLDAKKNKKIVLAWTIKNKKDYEKALRYCDNFICENMNEYV